MKKKASCWKETDYDMILLFDSGRICLAKSPLPTRSQRDEIIFFSGTNENVAWYFPTKAGEFAKDWVDLLKKDMVFFMRRAKVETFGMPTTVTVYREATKPKRLKILKESK